MPFVRVFPISVLLCFPAVALGVGEGEGEGEPTVASARVAAVVAAMSSAEQEDLLPRPSTLRGLIDENGVAVFESASAVALVLEEFDAPAVGFADAAEARDGDLLQLWIPTAHGIEHVIVDDSDERLVPGERVIRLFVGGATPVVDGDDVLLVGSDGEEQFRYSNLFVFDGAQQRQTAWFDVEDDAIISIHVEIDETAVAPLTIDPLISSPVVYQGGISGAAFGSSVARGDFDADGFEDVLVGQEFWSNTQTRQGRAMIMYGSATTLNAGDVFESPSAFAVVDGWCGQWVAAGDVDDDGDVDVVSGCPFEDSGNGRVYVFWNFNNIAFSATPTRLEPSTSQEFPAGHILVYDIGNDGVNEVVVAGSSRINVFQVKTTSSPHFPVQEVSFFPVTSSSDNTIAPFKRLSNDDRLGVALGIDGRAFVWDAQTSSPFLIDTASQFSVPSPALHDDPCAVAAGDIDGDNDSDIQLGCRDESTGAGRFRVYRNDGTTTFALDAATPIGGSTGEHFGSFVFSDDFNRDGVDDVAVCGHHHNTNQGRCRVWGGRKGLTMNFVGSPRVTYTGATNAFLPGQTANQAIVINRQITAADTQGDGARDLIIPDRNHASNLGAIRVFDGTFAGLKATSLVTLESNVTSGFLGSNAHSLAIGDINQDGLDDVVVGASDGSGNGRVLIFLGGSSMNNVVDRTITGSGGDNFGSAVAIGRFRGPTQPPSIAVSEPEADVGGTNFGRVLLFHAPPGGIPAATTSAGFDQQLLGPGISGERFGAALANCGNFVNANGDCLAIGAPNKTGTGGTVRIFESVASPNCPNAPCGLNTTLVASRTGSSNGSAVSCAAGSYGQFLAKAGNVQNSDGLAKDDLLVGSPDCSNGFAGEGRAFLYTGVSGGLMTVSTWFVEGEQAGALMGVVAGVGDVTNDGIADFAVGAPLLDTNSTDNGRLFVYKGSATTPLTSTTRTMSTTFSGKCASSIAGGFDFNRDGIKDIIEGEPAFSDNGNTLNEGRVRVFFGGDGTLDATPDFTIEGECSACVLGAAVGVGDFNGQINGDIYGDVAFSIPGKTLGSTNEGAVVIHVGEW